MDNKKYDPLWTIPETLTEIFLVVTVAAVLMFDLGPVVAWVVGVLG